MKSQKLLFKPRFFQILMLSVFVCFAVSCGDEAEPGPSTEPVSSFQFEISSSDWRVVNFTNFSTNSSQYTWDFGDGSSSTDKDPTHTYSTSGTYEVVLSASDGTTSKSSSKSITVSDPNEAIKVLTGDVSKTWKLFREGISMSLGSDKENSTSIWSGLANDGSRPCAYEQEFTFHLDGTYEFNDNGMFWAEYGVFNNVVGCDQNITGEACIEASVANMVNACGDDISAWLSGTHTFDYNTNTSSLTLNGDGAWIGIPKLGTSGETLTPLPSVMAQVSFEQFTGYDLMLVEFVYNGAYWPITYVSYSDPSLEPALETEAQEFGEDLVDISPTELSRTFASADAADWVLLDTVPSASLIFFGVDNPDGTGDKVGQYERIATDFQELQLQTAPDKNDINFENLTTISVDIYLPSTNDYTTTLTKNLVVGFGDRSKTEQWWTGLIQYEAVAEDLGLAEDMWHTITFDLADPDFTSNAGETPFDRNDLDMVFIGFGGSGHSVNGTFYIRNFVIN